MSQVQEFYRKDIDGLRAIAILSVVAYHAGLPGVPGGFVGVDVFFVLSGYLITSLLVAEARKDATISLRSFYARRIRRLFPALFVVVCVTCIVGFFALLPVFGQQRGLAQSAAATAAYVSNVYFQRHSPGYFDESSDLKPLLHTWSLSVEEQFYLLWPLMVLAGVRLARRRGWRFEQVLRVVTVVVLVASLAWCIRQTQVRPTSAFYLLPSRAWELATGAVLALWLPGVTRQRPFVGLACSSLGLIAICSAVATLGAEMAFPGYFAMLPVFGTALVVAGGHVAAGNPLQAVLSTRPMVLIGLLSYSWYLWHWPLLSLVRAYHLGESILARDLAIAGLSLLLAYASYRLVENPIRYGRPGPFRRTETTLAAGLAISLAMCLPALALGAWAEFVGGRRPEFASLLDAKNDRPPLRSKCHQKPPFTGLAQRERCVSGDGPPVLLLWGDSHADHLSPLMQEFAGDSPTTPVLARSFVSCPPVSGFVSGNPRRDQACGQFNAAVLAEIRELSRSGLRGVVLSGNWLNVFGAPEIGTIAGLPNGDGLPLAAPELVDSLAATVEQLTALGLNVLVVAPMPAMRYDVPVCLARRAAEDCGVQRRFVESQRREVVRRLVELESRSPNVRVFDPVDALCDPAYCAAERGGRILFADDDHLTATASRALLPAARGSLAWAASSD